MDLLKQLKKELKGKSSQKQANISKTFFKTNKGDYGEGDIFLGIKVPTQRKIAKKFVNLSLKDLETLLSSKIHEYRFTALIILLSKFTEKNASDTLQKQIYYFYIKNSKKVNNWDLVNISAPNIIGSYLLNSNPSKRKILYKFAKSKNLWEKRISIISTIIFIKEGQFADTLNISKTLLNDSHDLIHKAVGWMLREVGKKNRKIEEEFLKNNYEKISRTTLRYAIEKFPENLRLKYLKNKSLKYFKPKKNIKRIVQP